MSRATFDALGWTRDAVQARVIARLFAARVRGLALKGGMAFRMTHSKWARATKDIDLDADPDLPLATLRHTVRQAIGAATADGLLEEVTVTEPKQTDTTARWKIAGRDRRTGQMLHITVEVSRREHIQAEDVRQVVCGTAADDWVTVYTDSALAFRKMQALLSENREAPRDIADLYLLIQAKVEPPIASLRKFAAAGGVLSAAAMWAKLERMNRDMFKTEVLPSLPPTPDGQLLYQDWDQIRLTVGEHVQRWIELAHQADNTLVPEMHAVSRGPR